jgi:DNA repair protein RadC
MRTKTAAAKKQDELMPREKLCQHGAAALTEPELLAIIFGTGYRGEPVKVLSARLMRDYGRFALRDERNVARLRDQAGLPQVKACQLIACLELGQRLYGGGVPGKETITIRSPLDVVNCTTDMRNLRKEQLRGLYLNVRNTVIHQETISIGTITANLVDVKEVFRIALEYSAVAVIVVHNHPSGNPEPSNEDIAITAQLAKAAGYLDLRLLDHIIIAGDNYVSLNERGLL